MMGTPGQSCPDGVGGTVVVRGTVVHVGIRAAASDPLASSSQADQTMHVLRRVLANGTMTTLAGVPGSAGYSGEFLSARASLLSSPAAVAPYVGGYLVSNRGTCRISMVWPNGTLSTVAGTGSCGALSGDGGLALNASVRPNWGMLAPDPSGSGGGFVWSDQGTARLPTHG